MTSLSVDCPADSVGEPARISWRGVSPASSINSEPVQRGPSRRKTSLAPDVVAWYSTAANQRTADDHTGDRRLGCVHRCDNDVIELMNSRQRAFDNWSNSLRRPSLVSMTLDRPSTRMPSKRNPQQQHVTWHHSTTSGRQQCKRIVADDDRQPETAEKFGRLSHSTISLAN